MSIHNSKLRKGFTIREVGIGDGVQFTSLPENYFRATGKKLVDVSRPWYFDKNPFVDRDSEPHSVVELWNYPKKYEWPVVRPSNVWQTNAEIHCAVFGIKPTLIRPRLYEFEHFPFQDRELILLQPVGKSHGQLPDYVIDHVIKKYGKTGKLYQIGLDSDPDLGIPRLKTPTLWMLAACISQARMLICPDSGPAWIGACYPDVVVKKVRNIWQQGYAEPQDWLPLDAKHPHSFWDDRGLFQIYNVMEDDVGFTHSYRKL